MTYWYLAVLRVANLTLWTAVIVMMSGSLWRTFRGKAGPADSAWALWFFVAAGQIGFGAKWFAGLTAPPQGTALAPTAGLLLLYCLIAIGAMYIRHGREGWRW